MRYRDILDPFPMVITLQGLAACQGECPRHRRTGVPLCGAGRGHHIADQSSPSVIVRVGRELLLTAMASADVELLLPNAEEAVELTGASSVMAAACALGKMVSTVIVKTGATGAMYCADGESGVVAIESLAAIDTTGAGDAFNAGVLVALLRGESAGGACRFAHTVAAQAVVQYGGSPSGVG